MKTAHNIIAITSLLFIIYSISGYGPNNVQEGITKKSEIEKKELEEKTKNQEKENKKLEEERTKFEYCTREIESLKVTAKQAAHKNKHSEAIEILRPCYGVIADGDAVTLYISSTDKLKKIEEKKDAINAKRRGVSIGMTKEQVLASSWGRPQTINQTHGSFGTHEQWVYGGGYLYFENGTLSSVQN